jgi:3-oxoadipate enol-lactonase
MPHLPAALRVIRFDQRGHGLSDDAPGAWTVGDLADDLAGLLDALGVRAAVVVGLSVGGMVAQALAARRPELVRAAVLSNTAARIGTAGGWEARIRAVEVGGVAAVADAVLAAWFTPAFRAGDPSFPLWRNMLVRCPRAGYLKTCAAIRDADLTADAAALRLPVLALAGDADGSTPPDLVRATAALIPGARFETIEGAGHVPGVERPAETARAIAGFLAEAGFA